MKIPTKLKIGGHIYKVRKLKPKNLGEDCGKYDVGNNTISLDIELPHDQVEEALIHEIFHCLNSTMDHTFLDSLAMQFHQVLRDNKMLR